MSINRKKLQENVLRGVRLLDKKDPGWWNGATENPTIAGMVGHIDVDRLDLALATRATAVPMTPITPDGRGSYERGVIALGLSPLQAITHGFNAPHCRTSFYDSQPEYSYLTELWAAVIQSRRFPRRKIARSFFARRANKNFRRKAA